VANVTSASVLGTRDVRCLAAFSVVLVAVGGLSACSSDGGGARLSKREFIRSAETVCAEANKKIRAIGSPDLTNPQTTTDALGRLLTIQHQELGDLRDLEPPGTDRPAIKKWLDVVATALREADAALAALKRGDRTGVNDANAWGREAQLAADDLSRQYGINRCGSQEETPPPTTAA
jgi:hypothetical protein